jgi:hypothetical protein
LKLPGPTQKQQQNQLPLSYYETQVVSDNITMTKQNYQENKRCWMDWQATRKPKESGNGSQAQAIDRGYFWNGAVSGSSPKAFPLEY